LPCGLATVLVGVISGVVSTKLVGKMYLLKGAVLGLVLESGAMGLVLLLVQPFETAVSVVSQVFVPMVAASTIGLVLWMYLFNKWKELR
jgi:LytS/YehU family sensor histidine kinase